MPAVLVFLAAAPLRAQDTAVSPPTAPASAPAVLPLPQDGPAYPVSRFDLLYLRPDPDQPPLTDLLKVPVTLLQTSAGFVAPRPGFPCGFGLVLLARPRTPRLRATAEP